ERRDVNVRLSVVVVVSDGRAHAVEDPRQSGLPRHVAEVRQTIRTWSFVAEEGERRRLLPDAIVGGPVAARHEKQVRPSVAVVVAPGHAAAHRFRHPLVAPRAIDVHEVDSHRLSLLFEPKDGWRRGGTRRRRRLADLLFAAATRPEDKDGGDRRQNRAPPPRCPPAPTALLR